MSLSLVDVVLAALPILPVSFNDDAETLRKLAALSLEDLLEIEVVTVARTAQRVPQAPAAIHVINQEDIRRSGHSSIPELLRQVPGLHVARINSSSWAVAARGFNGRFNNKMLVMIDGRTVFTSLFSGVYWDVQDLPLSDIDRIEVIRGPGGSVWGANAVNGVINIITKPASETQGTEWLLRLAEDEQGLLTWRYGAPLGDKGHWRTYVKGFDRYATTALGGGAELSDEWSQRRGGFRMDWTEDDRDAFTFQGDVYDGKVGETDLVTRRTPPPNLEVTDLLDVGGGNLLGRWTRRFSSESEFELQTYVDFTSRRSDLFDDLRNTFDIDFQHRFPWDENNEILWGLGYRWISSKFDGSQNFDLDDGRRSDNVFSAFIQDQVTLIDDELSLIVGSKFEHNDFTGFEVQPSIRALWTPGETHILWGAISRAIRTPSVVQHDLVQTVAETAGPATTVFTTLNGNDDLGSDREIAYELGWRMRIGDKAYLDITGFYNDFSAADNFSVGATVDLGGGNFLVPVFFDNSRQADVYGVELELDVDVTEVWKIRSGLSWLDLDFKNDALGTPIQPRSDDEEPNWFGSLRSLWNVSPTVDFDVGLYAVDDLDDLNVPGYVRIDTRLAYHPDPSFELAIGVQNAGDGQHPEFSSELLSTAGEIQRSAYVQMTWRP